MIERKPTAIFGILVAISFALWWKPIVATLRLAVNSEEYTHILLIVPVSVALATLDWDRAKATLKPNLIAGIVMLAGSLVAALLASAMVREPQTGIAIRILSLVGWWLGAFVLCFGLRAFRVLVFPLLFLLWCIPLPDFVLARVVNLLQHGSAYAAYVMFGTAGVPVMRDGLILSIPGLNVEVARECSSIRSSLFLVVSNLVLAQIFLRSLWKKVVIVLASLILAVAKNGLRIFAIAMLGTRVDPGYLTGSLHHRGGVIWFLIAEGVSILLLWLFHRSEEKGQNASHQEAARVPRPSGA